MTGTSRRDAGAGSVLLLGVVGVLALLGAGTGVLGQASIARHRAEAAADLAALAAADAALGRASEAPCARASRTAAANAARLAACDPDADGNVTVTVVVAPRAALWPGSLGPARATARAGPAP